MANTVRSSKEGDSDESSDKSSSEKKDKTRKRVSVSTPRFIS